MKRMYSFLIISFSVFSMTAHAAKNNSNSVTNNTFIAVGYFHQNDFRAPLSYITKDSGAHWSVSNTLPPIVGKSSVLGGVACSSDHLLCSAVGYADKEGVSIPVSYISKNAGNDWSVSSTLPSALGTEDVVHSIACANDGLRCVAVGTSVVNNIHIPSSYVTVDGGDHWQTSTALPSSQSTKDNYLSHIACDSDAQNCVAVGYYADDGDALLPLAYHSHDGGLTWNAGVIPAQGALNLLSGAACDASGMKCVIVGSTEQGSTIVPLSYTTSDGGSHWVPSASLPSAFSFMNRLLSVACSSDGLHCAAVGDYTDPNTLISLPLSYTSQDGGVIWSLSTVLPPSQSVTQNTLYQVICNDSGLQCNAVGAVGLGKPSDMSHVNIPVSYMTSDGGETWVVSLGQPAAQNAESNELTAAS